MNIFFATTTRASREDAELYAELIEHCQQYGEVRTDHVYPQDLLSQGEPIADQTVHDRDMQWLFSSDVVIAEVTTASIGVGYVLGRAAENGKHVLCLFRRLDRQLSPLIAGSDRLVVRPYTTRGEAKEIIDAFIAGTGKKKVLTLTVVHQGDRVLLGQKKRGFGKGKWNGFGGKVQANESIVQAARRELEEEAGISTIALDKHGIITFHFEGDEVALEVHIYSVRSFTGEPLETEEMKPQWFDRGDIPYQDMWQDDEYWLPLLLAGKRFEGTFWFTKEGKIERKELKEQ